jgi:PPM family protein phosphatase
MKEFLFKPDAAILLCSDGLSDVLTAGAIRQIIERYDGDPQKITRDLVDAANQAGGKDNITAVFVAASDFVGASSPEMANARSRHSITRMRLAAADHPTPGVAARLGRALRSRAAFLVYGFVIGVLLALAVR